MVSRSHTNAGVSCLPRRRKTGVCVLLAAVLLGLFAGASALALSPLRMAEDSPHAGLLRHVFNQIPPVWKTERPLVVEEVSRQEMEDLIARVGGDDTDGDWTIDGCYEPGGLGRNDPATITLIETLKSDDAELVFAHEYGHLVWDELLTNADRSRYSRIWSEQKHDNRLVTAYAADSDEEGFAEAMAYFLRKPALLHKRDPRSWQFLNDLNAVRMHHRFHAALPAGGR
jgi:hypothetical protein